ncbi:MAG: CPXCG motif-containing cysteine-rich protein [Thiotrichales bacterium]
MLESVIIQCPYCWERIEIVVDPSVPEQCYVEDCFVCCRPILLSVSISANAQIEIQAARENE